MPYQVKLSQAADKALDKLPPSVVARIIAAMERLADNPYPPGAKKLSKPLDGWRIRVGDYRVLYTVEQKIITVFVFRIANRREAYR